MDSFRIDVVRSGKLAEGTAAVGLDAVLKAVVDATAFLEARVKEMTPVGVTGNLRGSIGHEIKSVGEDIVSTISTNAEYAFPVEQGSKPHMPPLQPIIDWVRSKLDTGRRAPHAGGKRRQTKKAKAEGEQTIIDTAQRIRWAIFHRGTSAQARKTVGRRGPTGGYGYFMFERALEQHGQEMEQRFFEPLGLEIARSME